MLNSLLDFLRDPAWTAIGVIFSLIFGFIGFYYTARNKLWLYLSIIVAVFILGLGLGTGWENQPLVSASEAPLIPVDSTKGWQSTGINVKKGNTVIISVKGGSWTLGRRLIDIKKYPDIDQAYISTPNLDELWHQFSENTGEGYESLNCVTLECPAAQIKAKLGSLIAKISNEKNPKLDEFFEVGKETRFTSPIDGILLLTMNDRDKNDNSGILLTKINVVP
ncbi:hypothetical protein [Crocosphaera sp.]|uniref:hypothetical protein n=1 Tax=Crocosphaera sp. TaxID=2729996 RepID=UPI002635D60F|nr:hypothetical protein [Crocosphaera sp.]MDJ0579161.1 hypothetical protein [Crocosphaera sp.]